MKSNSEIKITIIGVGNTLFSDEGVGVHVLPLLVEEFKDDPTVEIIEGATDGMMLLEPVEDAEYLIVVDAINAGKPSGTLLTLEGDDIPEYYGIKISVHQIGFQEVLWAAKFRERYPAHVRMFGIQPGCLDIGLELTEAVQKQLPQLAERIISQVNEWKDAS